MAEKYSKCPIVEALIDIQVDLPSDFDYRKFESCQKSIKKNYPNRREQRLGHGKFSIGPDVSSSVSTKTIGYIFESADRRKLFQARTDGFTFNQLAPYTHWEGFIQEAKDLWEVYRKVAKYRGFKRLAVRYINRFDINEFKIRVGDYFRVGPEIPDDLPQDMETFHFVVAFALEDKVSKAAITQTVVDSPGPEMVSILLDIDISRTESFPPGNELWQTFEVMRTQKNRVFNACISEKAKDLIR